MIGSSSLILSITLENEKAVVTSIKICNYSLEEVNEITTIRLLFRSTLNMFKGYQQVNGTFLVDRIEYYRNVVTALNEQMRINQYNVDQLNV